MYRQIIRFTFTCTLLKNFTNILTKMNGKYLNKLEKKYAPTLDNNGQICFVRSDFLKMKCVCKTQMMPPPDHKEL